MKILTGRFYHQKTAQTCLRHSQKKRNEPRIFFRLSARGLAALIDLYLVVRALPHVFFRWFVLFG